MLALIETNRGRMCVALCGHWGGRFWVDGPRMDDDGWCREREKERDRMIIQILVATLIDHHREAHAGTPRVQSQGTESGRERLAGPVSWYHHR